MSAARSLTYVPVVEIARRNDVNYVNRVYEDPEELHPEDSRRLGVSLKRLTTRVVLQGDYESIRAFIYELEQAPQFVVIDQVTLLEAEEGRAGDADGDLVDLLPGVECSLIAAGRSCWRCWSSSSPSFSTAPGRGSAAPAAGTSNPRSAARAGQATATAAPDVKLEALEAERPKPAGPTRNLFRFGRTEKPRAEPPPVVTAPPTPQKPPGADGAYGAADPAEVRRYRCTSEAESWP